MNISNMKNIVILKNLPSNIVEEAFVVLKENKKAKKYQYIDNKNVKNENRNTSKNRNCYEKNQNEYILKEAEMVIDNYLSNLEEQSSKKKNNIKKLECKYKKSVKLNFILGFVTVTSILLSFI